MSFVRLIDIFVERDALIMFYNITHKISKSWKYHEY